MSDLSIKDVVQRTYGDVAKSASSADKSATSAIAQAFGYSLEELSAIPEESNLGLSCGNPTAFASLKPGETVVDLGSGGGLDVFLAARCVGPSGKAIGIDMTPEMIALAQKNAKSAKDSDGKILTNVEFYLGTIDRIPVPDQSVDCVISNCVINLVADKNAVFQEIARILKPGGRLAASDLALKQDLPEELAADALAWAACISGAIKLDDYEKGLKKAGFHDIAIVDSHADINAYATMPDQVGCCAPPAASSTSSGFGLQMIDDTAATSCCGSSSAPTVMHEQFLELVRKYNLNDFAASVKIYAIKSA